MYRTSSTRESTGFILIGAVMFVLVLLVMLLLRTWSVGPLLILGPFWLTRGLLLRRARVEFDASGMTIHAGGIQKQRIGWDEVESVSVDPPGGPRLLRVHTVDRRLVSLPEFGDAERAAVLSAIRKRSVEI